MNIKELELSKVNWNQLNEFGLVEGQGNGFANTTPKADDLGISKYRPTFIKLKGKQTVYLVQYYSGCFYPMWYKVAYGMTDKQFDSINVIKK